MQVEWDGAAARAIIASMRHLDGALLPLLHALQERFGYIDRSAIPDIAEALNLSRAEIHGVLTFYPDFRDSPAEGRVIKLCRGEACQAQGCDALRAAAEAHLGTAIDAGAGRNGVALESVFCLGNCALGPAALVEGTLIGRLDIVGLIDLCAGAPIEDIRDRAGQAP